MVLVDLLKDFFRFPLLCFSPVVGWLVRLNNQFGVFAKPQFQYFCRRLFHNSIQILINIYTFPNTESSQICFLPLTVENISLNIHPAVLATDYALCSAFLEAKFKINLARLYIQRSIPEIINFSLALP